jgi:maltooligosyltrehalose trehalohydrolase
VSDGRSFHWGPQAADGGTRFRLWAPAQDRVALFAVDADRLLPMTPAGGGWFECLTDEVPVGGFYQFAFDDGSSVPDPAARAQRDDVHGPSRLVDANAYEWRTHDWKGRPWSEAVLYELHTGSFSEDGGFDGVARALDRLAALGVTAIELLPVAQFSGTRGWGYDGVLLYCPHSAYGGAERLKALVDAAHARGLMILLDVVYNHFGPDGNYLGLYAPQFFLRDRHTPWGPAIAFGRRPVRDFFVDNALYWLDEFRFDGLRFDAVDQIMDTGRDPFLAELARKVRREIPDRHIHLTCEDDDNSTSLLKFDAGNRPKLFTAEWNDDWHHVMHRVLTDEQDGHYEDYIDQPIERLAKVMTQGFDYQGEPSAYRDRRKRGQASAHLPPTAFIDFLQNHDQTGNRAFGERIDALAPVDAVETALALLLLSPHIPLLFMGEEYGEESPFRFFTDFRDDLAEAVRRGRSAEFEKVRAFSDPAARVRIPDPNALETFQASTLKPERTDPAKRQRREALIRDLLAARRNRLGPVLSEIGPHAGAVEAQTGPALTVGWLLQRRRRWVISANLSGEETAIPGAAGGTMVFERPCGAAAALAEGRLPAWGLVCRLVEPNGGTA